MMFIIAPDDQKKIQKEKIVVQALRQRRIEWLALATKWEKGRAVAVTERDSIGAITHCQSADKRDLVLKTTVGLQQKAFDIKNLEGADCVQGLDLTPPADEVRSDCEDRSSASDAHVANEESEGSATQTRAVAAYAKRLASLKNKFPDELFALHASITDYSQPYWHYRRDLSYKDVGPCDYEVEAAEPTIEALPLNKRDSALTLWFDERPCDQGCEVGIVQAPHAAAVKVWLASHKLATSHVDGGLVVTQSPPDSSALAKVVAWGVSSPASP